MFWLKTSYSLYLFFGFIGFSIAVTLDSFTELEGVEKFTNNLDTENDLGEPAHGWTADSQFMRGYLHYANSSSQIDINILNLTNPKDFNPASFENANGIWYFPHQVLFESSDDPVELFASFNLTTLADISMTSVYVRYYLHGNTTFRVYINDEDSGELGNINESAEWQERTIDLKSIIRNMGGIDNVESMAAAHVRIEFQTFVKNVDYFLLDKIITSSPEPPTTVTEPYKTQAPTTLGEAEPTTAKDSTTTEDDDNESTTKEGENLYSTTHSGTATPFQTTPLCFFQLSMVIFLILH